MEDRLYIYTNDVTMLPLKYNFPEINVRHSLTMDMRNL